MKCPPSASICCLEKEPIYWYQDQFSSVNFVVVFDWDWLVAKLYFCIHTIRTLLSTTVKSKTVTVVHLVSALNNPLESSPQLTAIKKECQFFILTICPSLRTFSYQLFIVTWKEETLFFHQKLLLKMYWGRLLKDGYVLIALGIVRQDIPTVIHIPPDKINCSVLFPSVLKLTTTGWSKSFMCPK